MHRILFFPKVKYPKLLFLILTYILAYFIFTGRDYVSGSILFSTGYLGIFIAGVLYSYGFTSGPATAYMLIIAKQYNPVIAAIIGGFGSLLGDLLIFEFLRVSFSDEMKKLSKEKPILFFERILPLSLRKFILPLTAAFFIASPLPDEIGVSLLAASNISPKLFSALDYIFNTTGIMIILYIGHVI